MLRIILNKNIYTPNLIIKIHRFGLGEFSFYGLVNSYFMIIVFHDDCCCVIHFN
jgi:hypothetical protein